MSPTPLLEISNLTGGYGDGIVLRNFTQSLIAGQVVAVLGRNGVGKSTLLKLVSGALKPSGGHITVAGGDITGLGAAATISRGMSYAPQERVVFDDLTVAENLTLMRKTRSLDPFEHYLAVFPRLRERLRQHAGTLSGGEKKLLSLSRTLAEDKQIVLLDEPTEGVQYENVVRMAGLIAARKAAGTGFLLVEQNLGLVDAVADRIVILDHGDIVLEGESSKISANDIATHLTF